MLICVVQLFHLWLFQKDEVLRELINMNPAYAPHPYDYDSVYQTHKNRSACNQLFEIGFCLTVGLHQMINLFLTLTIGSHFSLNGTQLWNRMACSYPHLKNGNFWHGRHGICYVSVHMVSKLSVRTSSRDIPTTTSFLSYLMVALWRLFSQFKHAAGGKLNSTTITAYTII